MLNTFKEMLDNLIMEFSPKCLRRFGVIVKPRVLIWLILNFVFIWNGYARIIYPTFLSISVYILLIAIALSSFTEKILRLLEDVRRVATKTEKDRLIPLFNEVYAEVKKQSQNISGNIRLYIVDQMIVNAFAIGRNTIVVTRGIMSALSDEEIKGVIAHEFAHIVNKDTQIAMLVTVATNLYIWGVLLIVKLLSLIERITGSNSFVGSLVAFIRMIIEVAVKYLLTIITVLVSSSSRKREYKADIYASKIGYKEQLISALYKLYDMQVSDKKNLVEKLKSSHPKLAYRIEVLENV